METIAKQTEYYTTFIFVDGIVSELENVSFIPDSLQELIDYIEGPDNELIRALTFVRCSGNRDKIMDYYSIYYNIIANEFDPSDFFKK